MSKVFKSPLVLCAPITEHQVIQAIETSATSIPCSVSSNIKSECYVINTYMDQSIEGPVQLVLLKWEVESNGGDFVAHKLYKLSNPI